MECLHPFEQPAVLVGTQVPIPEVADDHPAHPAIQTPATRRELGVPANPGAAMNDSFRQTPTCPKCGTAAHSSVRVFTTRTYERAIRKLLSQADRRAMEAAVIADPGASPVMRGTGGLRNQ